MIEMTTKEFEKKIKDLEGIDILLKTPRYDESVGHIMTNKVYDYFFDDRSPDDMPIRDFVARLKPSIKAYELVILDGNQKEVRSYHSTLQTLRDSYK